MRHTHRINNKKADGTTVSSFVYTHDLIGNRQTMQLLGNSGTITYTYNSVYELTGELRDGPGPQNDYSIAWTYDGVGNRLSQNKDGDWTYYVYNDANQLISDTASAYIYDPNGNLITKTVVSLLTLVLTDLVAAVLVKRIVDHLKCPQTVPK